eukprot:CAMPEP_0170522106 /NCGR_PEP_ID=MMETSP0209-20121228/7552_1 /TAXON_ID=665100 ORGANISM="Litonotus pictus, Strain P1" /NCGR_SAMPLE_ID=MMETSP0209 /ASSEMBLY_ACC=CAM_ASM_000301 /LENGTH=384 /DNA_ID=CAMNT_0010809437 /DNA_START=633 /DNA_END=1784 /DNA_ORIENTATION=+
MQNQVKLTQAIDIWSLGCLILQMATNSLPWKNVSKDIKEVSELLIDFKAPPKFPTNFSKEGKEFLRNCFRKEPEKRMTAEQLLQHDWFTKVELSSPIISRTREPMHGEIKINGKNMKIVEKKNSIKSKLTSNNKIGSTNGKENKPVIVNILKGEENNGEFSVSISMSESEEDEDIVKTETNEKNNLSHILDNSILNTSTNRKNSNYHNPKEANKHNNHVSPSIIKKEVRKDSQGSIYSEDSKKERGKLKHNSQINNGVVKNNTFMVGEKNFNSNKIINTKKSELSNNECVEKEDNRSSNLIHNKTNYTNNQDKSPLVNKEDVYSQLNLQNQQSSDEAVVEDLIEPEIEKLNNEVARKHAEDKEGKEKIQFKQNFTLDLKEDYNN